MFRVVPHRPALVESLEIAPEFLCKQPESADEAHTSGLNTAGGCGHALTDVASTRGAPTAGKSDLRAESLCLN